MQGAPHDLGEGRSVPAAGKRLDRFLELGELVVQRRGGFGLPKGRFLLIAGVVVMVAALDAGAGPEIVTWPMLLAGLGVGSPASQLGSVTVSSVPDVQSGDVGGLQNTVTNLGASIGTALAGAVLIATVTTSFLSSA